MDSMVGGGGQNQGPVSLVVSLLFELSRTSALALVGHGCCLVWTHMSKEEEDYNQQRDIGHWVQ